MRYLSIDLGDKRTGVAIGDDVTGIASPHEVVRTGGEEDRLRQLLKLIDDEGPDAVVVGLPLNMDGSLGSAALKAVAVGRQIAEASGVAVHFADERQTSQIADERMAQTGLTHKQKKARRDALAAAAILQVFFERGACEVPGDPAP
ncbi:MAG: Holliday junction resolvase RuvX [Phycisphaerales bacterium JB063]